MVDPGVVRCTDVLGAGTVAWYRLDGAESCTLFVAGLRGSVARQAERGGEGALLRDSEGRLPA